MKAEEPILTPPEGIPKRTDEVDEQLQRGLRQAHRVRWVLVAAVFILLIGAVVFQSFLLVGQQRELAASCQVWFSLSPLPVSISPQTGRPTKLGVSIIVGARRAYDGQKCGKLPPPDPSVVRWAKFYNLKLPR